MVVVDNSRVFAPKVEKDFLGLVDGVLLRVGAILTKFG